MMVTEASDRRSKDEIALIRKYFDVSHETETRLMTYVSLLKKWHAKINLVSTKSLAEVWSRHILDSAQIFPLIPDAATKIMDIGSGAGLPGLIIGIMRAGLYGDEATPVTMVESDQRKCVFLATAARECGVSVKIENKRLENMLPQYPDVITARALANVEKLLILTKPQHHSGLKCVFLKGTSSNEELTCLDDYPNIKIEQKPSLTDPGGVILTLTGFQSKITI